MTRALIILLALLLTGCLPGCVQTRDDSDMPDGRPSGMRVLSDNLTGCQYLAYSSGGITPRMGADGKQVCRGARP